MAQCGYGNDTVSGRAGPELIDCNDATIAKPPTDENDPSASRPTAAPGVDDVINGGNGNDRLFGDLGNDRITGGKGKEVIDCWQRQ